MQVKFQVMYFYNDLAMLHDEPLSLLVMGSVAMMMSGNDYFLYDILHFPCHPCALQPLTWLKVRLA